ncbi:MFS transporter [Agrococcus jejuensis]|uniref:Predicted arabinose efflux permease, MFS family n=1 Tax=Agrococcus jejuensis TaxID=399736 RepID=A0A1G8E263_9MICO|nr:MFS transporter [Agrococcus jejuensis]SDH64007.1 Predicted arabinose efflux permease, MFS family [Agrococcus jejuensis]
MREVLANRAYAQLFSAQVVALVGTGLLTVALGLLAYDVAGADAGVVLGIALTIKMVAYVGVAPVVSALTSRVPRKALLVTADVVRALVALSLPFVTEVWQVYALVFVLQSASATFTPAFQAIIPEVLPDERQYTRALSLSRLAYDLEALVSPALAAALLTVVTFHELFVGTVVGFVASALLVLATALPARVAAAPSSFVDRLTRGVRVFWRERELRALLALDLAVAAPTAMVIVNTVVLVQGDLGRAQTDVALLLATYGAGSMLVALAVPRVLDRIPDRPVMLAGAAVVALGLVAAAAAQTLPDAVAWPTLVAVWVVLGAGNAGILTAGPRLIRRAASLDERPAAFAAQFSLSHACYLVTYPLAGVLGAAIGLPTTALVLAGIAALGLALATVTWRMRVPAQV